MKPRSSSGAWLKSKGARFGNIFSVILIVGFLANCATGDVWDDAHTIQRFKEELADATMKQLECRTGLTDLWERFKKGAADRQRVGRIHPQSLRRQEKCSARAPIRPAVMKSILHLHDDRSAFGCVIVWQLIGMVLDARSARKQDLISHESQKPLRPSRKKKLGAGDGILNKALEPRQLRWNQNSNCWPDRRWQKILTGKRRDNGKVDVSGGHMDPGEGFWLPLSARSKRKPGSTSFSISCKSSRPRKWRRVRGGTPFVVFRCLAHIDKERATNAADPDKEVQRTGNGLRSTRIPPELQADVFSCLRTPFWFYPGINKPAEARMKTRRMADISKDLQNANFEESPPDPAKPKKLW